MNMNQRNLDALLSMASKKFGTTPEELKKNLQSGNLSQFTQGMNENDSTKFQQAVSDKALAQKILSSPEAQDIMRKLSEKK